MAPPDNITETVILRVKKSVNLENVTPGAGAGGNTAEQTFVQLTETLKAQDGFVRQFWGHQVEDPSNFVWVIDWRSYEHRTAFVKSAEHKAFTTGIAQVFDVEAARPLTIYTRFKTDAATASFEAPVTEVAFYTLPTETYNDKTRATVDAAMKQPSMAYLQTVGKIIGGTSGWVFETENTVEPAGRSIALHGVFGYETVDDHRRWRETPEHAQVIKDLASMGELDMGVANLPGGGIFIPDDSMFHVRFHSGA